MTTQENRSTILEYIFRHAPVARSTIAKNTDYPRYSNFHILKFYSGRYYPGIRFG